MNILPTGSKPPTGSRQPVDRATLVKMAQEEITALTQAQETFSAYDITKRLRAKFPHLEISHPEVRDFGVHPTMQTLIAQGLGYECELRNYPDGQAKTYLPKGSVIQGVTIKEPASLGLTLINWN